MILRQNVHDFIELNSDMSLPFSDTLDEAILLAKREVDKVFADYERVAQDRRLIKDNTCGIRHAGPCNVACGY